MPEAKKKGERIYTPQEIMAYYHKNKKLPPEIQKRVEKGPFKKI